METLHACILATDLTRLGQSSDALLPYLGRPLVTEQLEVLAGWGVAAATLLVRDDEDLVRLGATVAGVTLPCKVVGIEPDGTDTWSGVRAWLAERTTSVLTLNANLLLGSSWGAVVAEHRRMGTQLTLAAAGAAGTDGRYGRPRTLPIDEVGMVAAGGRPFAAHDIGLSIAKPSALRELTSVATPGEGLWPDELASTLAAAGQRVRMVVHKGPWRGLCTWRRVWTANADRLALVGRHAVAPTAFIHPNAELRGWVSIGPGAVVGAGAVVSDSVVAQNTVVGSGARLHRAVLAPLASIASGQELDGSVLLAGGASRPMFDTPRT